MLRAAVILISCTIIPVFGCETPLRMPTELTAQERQLAPWPMVEQIFKKAGCSLEWVPHRSNTARLFRQVENGELDVLPEASIRPERLMYAHFSKPYRIEKVKMYVLTAKKDQYNVNALDDLITHRYIVVDDGAAWLGNEWAEMRKRLDSQGLLTPAKDPVTDLRLLHKNMADIIIGTDGWELSTYTKDKGITALSYVVHNENVQFMFSLKSVSKNTVAKIDEAIDWALTQERYK